MHRFNLDPVEVQKGSAAFRANEPRDAMYKVAAFWLKHFWGKPAEMADGLGVLLLTWNQSLYRYGSFDFGALEQVIAQNMDRLNSHRQRDILSFVPRDEPAIADIFNQLLDALKCAAGKKQKSPVAVAKALHLLAPAFFPLWDKKIADGYECCYVNGPEQKYIDFMRINKQSPPSYSQTSASTAARCSKLLTNTTTRSTRSSGFD